MAEELEAYITMLEARRRALQEQVAGG
jgi:hypothetical protein